MRTTSNVSASIIAWLDDEEFKQHLIVQHVLMVLIANNYAGNKAGNNRWVITNYTRGFDQDQALDQAIVALLYLMADEPQEAIVDLADYIWGEIRQEALA
jgi:hypothetical protein